MPEADHRTTTRADTPQRPCEACGQRAWRRRMKPPAGAWECAVCCPEERALAAFDRVYEADRRFVDKLLGEAVAPVLSAQA